MLKFIGERVSDPVQNPIINIVVQETGLIHINAHTRSITEGLKYNFKCNPFLTSTEAEHNHIIYKEKVSERELMRNLNALDLSISTCIIY